MEVTMDLPTPPLPETTPMTFFILESSWGASRKLFLSRDEQFELQLEQSCVHSLIAKIHLLISCI
jgi:hypothetical protein